jgi:putative DeoR family transcriptional regulator (stage III sporulation protein D)
MSNVDSRVLHEAKLMLEGKRTVREVARLIGFSKSTVHNDVAIRLKQIDYDLYLEIKELLEFNKKIRHIRGGEATKKKYQLKLR